MRGYKLGPMKPTPTQRALRSDRRHPRPARGGRLSRRPIAGHRALSRAQDGAPAVPRGRGRRRQDRDRQGALATLGRRLIRLQCYEGLDVSAAVYEWNYAAQMIAIRVAEAEGTHDRARLEHDVFSERSWIKRPLLQALEPDPAGAPVLLIDELDRADEAFEAFLLEVLADFQVTIPELGTIKAANPPIVIVALEPHHEDHDALDAAASITGGLSERRARIRHRARQGARRQQGAVRAGRALVPALADVQGAGRCRDARLGRGAGRARRGGVDPATVSDTLGVLLKYQDDIARIEGSKAKELVDLVRAAEQYVLSWLSRLVLPRAPSRPAPSPCCLRCARCRPGTSAARRACRTVAGSSAIASSSVSAAAQSSVSATPGDLNRSSRRSPARRHDLRGQRLADARHLGAHDLRFALDRRIADPVVEAATLQRVVDLAGAVRGEHHDRRNAPP